ncbi:MAG: SDR family oxidoreductase [Planctomycetota bacterium]
MIQPACRPQPTHKQYILLTGVTGLVGRYLLRNLLLRGCRVAVLVRPSKKMKARERVEQILQFWESQLGKRLPRPVILSGDICEPNLGLANKQVQWCHDFVDQVIHNAAVLRFHSASENEDPWRTNVGGTKNVLEFSKLCGIRDFHYVSTAYVCGKREETFHESDFDCQQEFRNDYEVSKFQAEKLVRDADFFETTTIYRPAVIVGDSETGYTSTYHGLYLYLRFIDLIVPDQATNEAGVYETKVRWQNGDTPRNLVPIDWVSKAIAHLVTTREAYGRTYHLVPDKGATSREIIEYCREFYNSSGVEFCEEGEECPESEFAAKLSENTSIYKSYEAIEPTFDKSNLNRFAGHLVCPPITKEMIFRFIEFGRNDRWGKARSKPVCVDRWIEAHLTEIALATQKTMGALGIKKDRHHFLMGLDIHGPGGGQWQIESVDGKFEITPGLPDDSCPVLTLSDLQIDDLLQQSGRQDNKSESQQINWSQPLESVISNDNQRVE